MGRTHDVRDYFLGPSWDLRPKVPVLRPEIVERTQQR